MADSAKMVVVMVVVFAVSVLAVNNVPMVRTALAGPAAWR